MRIVFALMVIGVMMVNGVKVYEEDFPHITSEMFQRDVIEASRVAPVFVEWRMEACAPCKVLEKRLHALTQETGARIVAVDLDLEWRLGEEWGVVFAPTLQAYAGGELVGGFQGLRGDAEILDLFSLAASSFLGTPE